MREIVLDTETTGMDPEEGHRLVEIGCVELVNHIPTGNNLHLYFNPMRDVPEEVVKVHGLTNEFLADKPLFSEKVDEFLEFIKEDALVIHNAAFDMKFLNAELKSAGMKPLTKNQVIDTLPMAREKFPGQAANLDALCRRFKIDNSNRTLHGALLDSELLAEVYLELIGGRQQGFALDSNNKANGLNMAKINRQNREKREFPIPDEDLQAHEGFVAKIKESIWSKIKN